MFELPEYITLARQMNETLKGKSINSGLLGNTPHKFVWYNRTHEEFENLLKGKAVGAAKVKGRWLFLEIEPGYVLVLGEFGGKVLYHPAGSKVPAKYHLFISFDDDSFFTATTQMWGAVELYEKGQELSSKYVKGMKTTPIEPEFTYEYFCRLIDDLKKEGKKSVKGLLTQDQTIPGLGNAIAQDIMFNARLHPKHSIEALTDDQQQQLYRAIIENALKNPCPQCGGTVEKIQYLGGACYFCGVCQR